MRKLIIGVAVVALVSAACGSSSNSDPSTPTTTGASTTTTTGPPATACPMRATSGPPIEVTQAVQTASNTVQLIADRSTAVRVSPAAGDLAGGDVYSGLLHVYVDGTEVTPGGVSPINGPVTAPGTPDRDNTDHSLNFELATPTGIGQSSDVEVCVELMPNAGGVEVASLSGLNFTKADNPRLFYTSVAYDGLGLANAADIQPGVGDAFVRGIYPFDDSDGSLYRQSPAPTLTNSTDTGTPQFVDQGTDVSNLLADLGVARQLIVSNGLGADNNTFLYGWLPDNPISGNGWASVGGRVAFGNTQLSRSQRTYAHELGHNFGLNHNSRSLAPETGWDTFARLDANPSGNNTTGEIKVSALNDIMRGGQLTNTAWVDTETYQFFLNSSFLGISPAPDSGADEAGFGRNVAVVTGVLTPDGSGVERMFPVQRFPWESQPTTPPQDSGYVVVIEAGGDTLRVPFSGRIAADDDGLESERFGYFEVMVPVDPDAPIDFLTIATVEGDVLAEVVASEPPEVFWEVPQDGGELDGRAVWGVDDPDTGGDGLVIQLVFSPDDGESWVPVAVNLPGSTRRVAYDPSVLPPTDGDGVLRLIVSDGLNTTVADVGRLSEVDEASEPTTTLPVEGVIVPGDRDYPTLEKRLITLGLPSIVRFVPRFDEFAEPGFVSDVDPPPGTEVQPGTTVRVEVTSGLGSDQVGIVIENGVLVVGVRDDETIEIDEEGTPSGPQVDIIEATADKLAGPELAVEYAFVSAADAFNALEGGEVDLLLNGTEPLDGFENIAFDIGDDTFFIVVTTDDFARELRLNLDRVVIES